jgi:hypothetical protein
LGTQLGYRLSAPTCLQTVNERKERGQRQQCEESRRHQPADHHNRQWPFELAALAGRRTSGSNPSIAQLRHQLRPYSTDAGLSEGITEAQALLDQRPSLRNQDETVLDRDSEQSDETNRDDTLSVSPVRTSARMPPTNASGSVSRTFGLRARVQDCGNPSGTRDAGGAMKTAARQIMCSFAH